MNTCNLRSFFPGSQPDYHQPICPKELSGDMNSLLNSFLEQKQTQKGCVWRWGRGLGLSQPFYDRITKDKVRTNNGQPLHWSMRSCPFLSSETPAFWAWPMSGKCLVLVVPWNQEADAIRDCTMPLEFCNSHLLPRNHLLKRNKENPFIKQGHSTFISLLIFKLKLIIMAATESKTASTCESF